LRATDSSAVPALDIEVIESDDRKAEFVHLIVGPDTVGHNIIE
jgi:hypothetical protein